MTTPAELVRDNAALLAGYHPRLEYLLAEPSSREDGIAPLPADAPFPGNAQAFAALMVITEKVPRLEARLKLEVAGHPGMRRGLSTGNFLAALSAIPGLAAGLDEDGEAAVARLLEWLVNLARSVRAIDEAQQWRYVRGRRCPYCKNVTLQVLLDAARRPTGHVECHTWPSVRCADGNGYRPAATMGTDEHGVPGLQWADGTWEPAPDMNLDG